MIREATREASLAAQLPLASNVVVGRLVLKQACKEVRPAGEACLYLLAEEVLKGPPLADTLITVVVPSRNAKVWQRGVYMLTQPDSLGHFRPVHPDWSYFPALDDQYVVGFRLVSGEPIDCLMPILADRDEIVHLK